MTSNLPGEREDLGSVPEPVSPWTAWLRKSDTIRSVSRRTELLTPQTLRERLASIQRGTLTLEDGLGVTRAFWAMEKTASEYFKQTYPQASLRDPQLPEEVRPIAHCGMGIGAVERLGFAPDVVLPAIHSTAHPDYRLFACESIGAMLGVYEPGPFLSFARSLHALGLIPMVLLSRPDPREYRAAFSAEEWDLISHGFGRLLYFRNHSLAQALAAAQRAEAFEYTACVRGIAFALSMVNSRDVRQVLSRVYAFPNGRTRDAFEQGLVYALVFWEWMSPGFLERFSTPEAAFRERQRRAEAEIDAARRRGAPPAFSLALG